MRKIEAEVRALQRKVFPGGDGRYFEPQISAPAQTASQPVAGSTTALTDILARLDGLESQLQSLTAQTEENSNAIRMLTSHVGELQSAGGRGSGNGSDCRDRNAGHE